MGAARDIGGATAGCGIDCATGRDVGPTGIGGTATEGCDTACTGLGDDVVMECIA